MNLYEINTFLIYRQRSPTAVETAFFKNLSERIIDPIIGRRRLLDNDVFVKSINLSHRLGTFRGLDIGSTIGIFRQSNAVYIRTILRIIPDFYRIAYRMIEVYPYSFMSQITAARSSCADK